MKVDVFHPALDLCGGAEVVAVAITNILARNGHEVQLLVNKEIKQEKMKRIIGGELSSAKTIVSPAFLQPRRTFHLYESAAKSFMFKARADSMNRSNLGNVD